MSDQGRPDLTGTGAPQFGPPTPPAHNAEATTATAPAWSTPVAPGPDPLWYQPAAAGVYPYPPAAPAAPARSAGRVRIALAGLLAGAVVGGGAGAGVVALTDGADATAGRTVPAQSVTITDPENATAVTAAAAKAGPSVVTVYVTTPSGSGSGSGVVLTEDGYVLTNDHVVDLGGNAQVQVRTADGTVHEATIVGTEPSMDLAVLRLADAEGLTPATFADSSAVQVGDLAVAIGAPLGLTDTVTDGIVSATHRAVMTSESGGEATVIDAIQTDAAINPGNSGGALVDAGGEVIGINTAIATVPAGPGQQPSSGNIGVGFAIPGSVAERVAREIIEDGDASLAYLGVSAQTAGEGQVGTGAQLVQVQPGTPAADAGLQPGDVVTALGDRPVTTSTDLTAAVRSAAPDDEVTLTVRRGEATSEVEVTLGATDG